MPCTRQPTKTGTRKLSEITKHLKVPKGIASTSWPRVEYTCRTKLGLEFDDWQDGTGRLILAKREDGQLASKIDGCGLSVMRQVGKTFLVGGLVFGLCVDMPDLLVIWSAHHSRTHAETFLAMQDFATRPKIAPYIKQVFTGSGDEAIVFHNGSRILFGARERGFGRGIPGVDIIVFDEAQILSDRALANILPTLNTSLFGLHLYIGTPPKPEDMAEAFTRMRVQALKDELADGAWIEIGADDGADSDDRNQWAKNPSFPKRTPIESMLRLRRKLTDEDWRREGMGVWDEFQDTKQVIAGGDWARLEIPADEVPLGKPSRFALAMSPERVASIAVAIPGEHAAFLDLAEISRVDDSRKVIDWLAQRCGRRIPVMIDSRDPAAAFINELRSRGVKVNATTQSDAARACMGLLTAVEERRIWHVDQPAIRTALRVARKKPIGKAGLWEWDLEDPTPEMAALRSMTLAHFGLSLIRKRAGSGRTTGARKAVVLG